MQKLNLHTFNTKPYSNVDSGYKNNSNKGAISHAFKAALWLLGNCSLYKGSCKFLAVLWTIVINFLIKSEYKYCGVIYNFSS